MEKSNMKNMVILKNLPSNLVEEAIVVIKPNKKVKKLEKVDKMQKIEYIKKEDKDKNYILKEAEMIVNNYITQIEKGEKKDKSSKIKKYNLIITAIAVLEFIGLLIS